MASYDTDLKKQQKAYEAAKANQITIGFTDVLMGQYAQKVDDLSPIVNVNYPLVDKGTDYQLVSQLLNDPPTGNFLGIFTFGADFDITIKGIPGKYIPFVRFAFISNNTDADFLTGYQLTWFATTKTVGSSTADVYDATWHVGWHVQGNYNDQNPINVPDSSVKITLLIINPAIAL